MAAYAATVSLESRSSVRLQHSRLGVLFGKITVSNYNQTLAEITGVTNLFRGDPIVMLSGISSNGYVTRWDPTGKAVKAYYPTDMKIVTGSTAAGDATSGALVEDSAAAETVVRAMGSAINTTYDLGDWPGKQVAADVNVGDVNFFAVGVAR